MAHAPQYLSEIKVPAAISDRYVTYHEVDFEERLLALEHWRPGLFDAMLRMIGIMEADPTVENITVDFDEDSILYPVTIWADSTFPADEREANLKRIHDIATKTLNCHDDLVLVAVM